MTTSTFKIFFQNHPAFQLRKGIYYQRSFQNNYFEQQYTQLREKEGRLYTLETLKKLPDISPTHPLSKEWKIRKHSTQQLVRHLRRRQSNRVLEVGCGNGWLIHYIQDALQADCCGVDVNETELVQAAMVFGNRERMQFVFGDILSNVFTVPIADSIIVASALQYFERAENVIQKLLNLLHPNGEIHIIDTPFYSPQQAEQARIRSAVYFNKAGQPEMNGQYFHHTWDCLSSFDYRIVHNPFSLINRFVRPFNYNSPFPWVVIKRSSA